MIPEQCPRFNRDTAAGGCNAAICPLDPDWRKRVHAEDDRPCHYLREASKPGALDRYAPGIEREIISRSLALLPEILEHSGAELRWALKRASRTPSRRKVKKGGGNTQATNGNAGGATPALSDFHTDHGKDSKQ